MRQTQSEKKLCDQTIIAIASANGWVATFTNEATKPVAFWAINAEQQCSGVIIYDKSFENAASQPFFNKYEPIKSP